VLTSAVGVKRPGREVGQSCLSGTEVKKEWAVALLPPPHVDDVESTLYLRQDCWSCKNR